MISLNLPLTQDQINSLKVGDLLLLSGKIYAARDQAHKRFMDEIPFDIRNQSIYYVGPTFNQNKTKILSAGPTTSSRMDAFTPTLYEQGLKITIGKGRRNGEVENAIKKHQGLYLSTFGGAGAFLAECIVSMKIAHYPELLSEAVFELEVKDFPCIVIIDGLGHNFYKE
ncbi:MAG: FumA C-terminus/TtdB family hydratase beta subunit [Erysipelotrichaceae bacterium]